MASSRVIWLLLLLLLLLVTVMVRNTTCMSNGTRWELLEAAADRIHIEDEHVRESTPPEGFRYYLWNYYKGASRSQRFDVVEEMSETLKQRAFRESRLDMIGIILFGPEKGRAFLSLKNNMLPEHEHADVLGYVHCVETVEDLFTEHCGPQFHKGLRLPRSLLKLCSLATQAAIEDAIIHSCGLNVIQPVQQEQDADDKGVAHWAMHILSHNYISELQRRQSWRHHHHVELQRRLFGSIRADWVSSD